MSNYEYTLFGFIKQAAPDPGTFSISKDDLLGVDKPRMNAHFKRTGADNVRSEMDRWKTIMAERGYGNMSNRDYRKWKKNPNKLYKLLATSSAAPKAAPVVAPKPTTVVTPRATPVVTPKATPVVTPAAKVPTATIPDPAPTPGQAPVAAPTATPAPAPTPAPTPDPTPAPAQTPGQAPAPASVVAPVATPSPAPTPASGAALIDASVFNSVPTYTPAPKPNFTPDSIHIPGMTVIRDDSGMTSQERFDKALSDQSKLVSELQAGYVGDPQNAELKAKYDAEKDKANVLRTVSNLNSLQFPTESMNEVQLDELANVQNALQYAYQKFADDPNNMDNYIELKNVQQAYSDFIGQFTKPVPANNDSVAQQPTVDLQDYISNMMDFSDLGHPDIETLIDNIRNESLYDFGLSSDNNEDPDSLPGLRKRILDLYYSMPANVNNPNHIYELGNLIAAYSMKQKELFNKAPGKYNHIIQAPIDSNTFRQAVENAAVNALNYGVSL